MPPDTEKNVALFMMLALTVGVTVIIMIFLGVLNGQAYSMQEAELAAVGNNVVVNETFTALINTSVGLNHGLIQTGTLTLTNTTGSSIGLGNFTVDYIDGSLYLNTLGFNGTAMLASYTWGANEIGNYVRGGIAATFSAMENTADYLPLVILGVIIGLVLTIILGIMAYGSMKGTYGKGGGAL